jgi:hypothetical protein
MLKREARETLGLHEDPNLKRRSGPICSRGSTTRMLLHRALPL